jgi:hypothetical protein
VCCRPRWAEDLGAEEIRRRCKAMVARERHHARTSANEQLNTCRCTLRQCSARPVARLAVAEVVFEALLHAALGQAGSSTMRVPGPPAFARVPGPAPACLSASHDARPGRQTHTRIDGSAYRPAGLDAHFTVKQPMASASLKLTHAGKQVDRFTTSSYSLLLASYTKGR